MDFECTKRGEVMVVAPKGSINTESAPKLEKKLVELQGVGERQLVIDFAQIDYISSAGLRVLLMTARRLKSGGGALALCSMNPGVTKVFALCGFERDFTIVGGRDEAISRVGAAAASAADLASATAARHAAAAEAAAKPVPMAAVEVPAAVSSVSTKGSAPPAAAAPVTPNFVADALRALAAGLAARPRAAAEVPPALVERARRALTPTA